MLPQWHPGPGPGDTDPAEAPERVSLALRRQPHRERPLNDRSRWPERWRVPVPSGR